MPSGWDSFRDLAIYTHLSHPAMEQRPFLGSELGFEGETGMYKVNHMLSRGNIRHCVRGTGSRMIFIGA